MENYVTDGLDDHSVSSNSPSGIDSTHDNPSRRKWLRNVGLPTLVTLSVGLIGAKSYGSPLSKEDLPEDHLNGTGVYNIRDFGAKGDGEQLDTLAIQKAIDTCSNANGGIVLVPAGDYLIGTIELKANVTLELTVKGRLLGSPKRSDYKEAAGIPKSNGNVALIFAANAAGISIIGKGTIDGNGKAFYTGHGDNTGPGSTTPGYMDRPHLLVFYKCPYLRVQDVLLTQSAYHCFRILECDYVHLHGIQIYSRVNKNNDGFHFGSSTYVHISNCDVKCQDDACALFGSNQFITISDCSFSTRWSVFRFGGGKSQNITVTNCLIYDTYGCPIKISAGRCQIENLSFSNIIMRNVTGPISIGFSGKGKQKLEASALEEASYLRNISFSHIEANIVYQPVNHPDIPFDVNVYPGEQHSCISLNAWGNNYIENIRFNDIHVRYAGGGSGALAAKREIPEVSAEYFGVWNKPPYGPPAYGLYARNVKGLHLQDVRFDLENPDARSAVIFDNVQDASIHGLDIAGSHGEAPGIQMLNSKDILMTATRLISASKVFLQVEGSRSEAISLFGCDYHKAPKALSLLNGTGADAVRL